MSMEYIYDTITAINIGGMMKAKFIHIILLLALTFNIVHASVIVLEDHCEHETACEYVNEQIQDTHCGDLCDFHYLFHLTAIIDTPVIFKYTSLSAEAPKTDLLTYHPPFKRTENKPPIA